MGKHGSTAQASPCLLPFLLLAVLLLAGQCAAAADPYKVLQVERNADADTIKRNYRALAKKYHPDKAGGKYQNKFIEVQQAYETLSDPTKKREYDLGSTGSRFSSGGGFGRNAYSHFYSGDWGNPYSGFGGSYRRAYDVSFDSILPSETTLLTSTNMRNLIFYGTTPWLIQIYAENSPTCKTFSPVWESLHKVMTSSGTGKPYVSMGRINWRHQINLASWLINARFTSGAVSWSHLPLVYGVPLSCKDPSCFVRYHGPMTVPALQDYAASKLMKLPAVPSVSPASLDVLLQRVHPAKVVALAFSKTEGSGSIPLRQLAQKQRHMMHFARVAVGDVNAVQKKGAKSGSSQEELQAEQEAAVAALKEWSQLLGVQVTVPSLVLLRGPGATPEVLTMKPGEVSGYEDTINSRSLMWQLLPALRPHTVEQLGCKWWDGRRQSVYTRGEPVRLCVALVGRGRMEEGRKNMLKLTRLLALLSTPSYKGSPAATAGEAIMAGKLRVVWLDADVQHSFCVDHFGDVENGGSVSADSERMRAICGSEGSWGASLRRSLQALLSQDFSLALRELVTPDPHTRTGLAAFVPTPSPSTRGREAPVHLFSTLLEFPHIDSRPLTDNELMKIALWASRCLEQENSRHWSGWLSDWFSGKQTDNKAGPLQVMQDGRNKLRYPSPLQDDEGESAVEFLLERARQVWEPMRDAFGAVFLLAGPEAQQLVGLIATVLVILLLNKWTARQEGG